MKKEDTPTSCLQGKDNRSSASQVVNAALNVCGIMFFAMFLGYIALHCF